MTVKSGVGSTDDAKHVFFYISDWPSLVLILAATLAKTTASQTRPLLL